MSFDSRRSGTSDSDLQASLPGPPYWSAGNIKDVDLGIILILQENNVGCETGIGICSDPDDEGHRPAGYIGFDFDTPLRDFGFDLIDVESITAELASIELIDELSDGSTKSETLDLMDYLDMGTTAMQHGPVEFGNNSANRFAKVTAESLGLDEFDRAVLHLGGSGAIDNIHGTPVPEPSSALLIALGLAGLAIRRR